MTARRPDRHNWSGARLPTGRNILAVPACFRCAEEDRRKLLSVLIVHAGVTLGSTLLCPSCAAALQPLDPDPLDVTEIA